MILDHSPSGHEMVQRTGTTESLTEIWHVRLPKLETDESVANICRRAIEVVSDAVPRYTDLTAVVTGSTTDKDGGTDVEHWEVEVTSVNRIGELGVWNWEIKATPSLETRNTDKDGEPIVVSYPPAVSWFPAGTSIAVVYQQYEDQIAEFDAYVPGAEITGTRRRVIDAGKIGDIIQYAPGWQGKINHEPFFGWARRNVLCLGLDLSLLQRTDSNGWLIEETLRFICRVGGGVVYDDEGVPHTLEPSHLTPGGWDDFAYWIDPSTGLTPKNAKAKRVQIYKEADFNAMITTRYGEEQT